MYKRNKTPAQRIHDVPSKSFLPRPEPLARFTYTFYSRPLQAFIIILILAILLGAARGMTVEVPWYVDFNSSELDFEFIDDSGGPYSGGDSETNSISEGETSDHSFFDSNAIESLSVSLFWEDEPDMGFRNNEPDRFTLDVEFGSYSESFTDENPPDGPGLIGKEWFFDYEEFADGISIELSVTLEYAGDQMGPVGLPRSPATVDDDSNEYSISIHYEYFDPDN
jgi:hypothetical protein